MKNKRNKIILIKSDISNDELIAMLDGTDSGGESDAEFVSDKPINDTHYILVPEANIHVAYELTETQQKDCEVVRKKRKCQLIMT